MTSGENTQEQNKETSFDDPLLQAQAEQSENPTPDTHSAEQAFQATHIHHSRPKKNNENDVEELMEEMQEEDEDAVEEDAPESEVQQLEAKLAEMKETALRVAAENENLRRRVEKEKSDTAKYAVSSFAKDLLNVSDNLRRALDAVTDEQRKLEGFSSFLEGVEMTERELLATFEKNKIEKIDPKVGEDKYDYNFHQAMFEQPSDEHDAGVIMQVMQTGYKLHDRLLRPALVGVAK